MGEMGVICLRRHGLREYGKDRERISAEDIITSEDPEDLPELISGEVRIAES
jgi:hypothetical protein